MAVWADRMFFLLKKSLERPSFRERRAAGFGGKLLPTRELRDGQATEPTATVATSW